MASDCYMHTVLLHLLHPGIQYLYVSVTELNKEDWDDFFNEVATRAPHITCLNLFCEAANSYLIDKSEDDFAFISGLHELQELHLAEYFLSPALLSILAGLPDLEIINFDDPEREHIEARGARPESVPLPSLPPESFPSLDELSIPGALGDIRVFFSQRNAPRNITTLRIFGLEVDTTSSVRQFLEFTVETCPYLEEFALRCFSGDVTSANDTGPNPEIDLSFAHFRPLLRLHDLIRFECYNFNPLLITADDLTEMARNWPKIEFIHLAPEPWHLMDPSLKLSDLSIVASQFENLVHLGIYLDARSTSDLPEIVTRFPALRSIFFGTSPISNYERVAPYVMDMCPELEYYVDADDFTCATSASAERGVEDYSYTYNIQWNRVFQMFRSKGLDGTNYVMLYESD